MFTVEFYNRYTFQSFLKNVSKAEVDLLLTDENVMFVTFLDNMVCIHYS